MPNVHTCRECGKSVGQVAFEIADKIGRDAVERFKASDEYQTLLRLAQRVEVPTDDERRFALAKAALTGLLAKSANYAADDAARDAVEYADAVLAELDRIDSKAERADALYNRFGTIAGRKP